MRTALLLAALLVAPHAYGASVALQWDVHPDTTVTGYKVYWGSGPRTYLAPAWVAGRTTATYTVGNLPAGTWYFAVTAVNATGESAYSNEISRVITPPIPTPPTGLRITNVAASTDKFSARIRWATNLPASCMVLYGERSPTIPMGGAGIHTLHSVLISGLKNKRTYQCVAISRTPDGTEARSEVFTFTTG